MKIEQSNRFGALTSEQLSAFELRHGLSLPEDYRQFMIAHNGGVPIPDAIDFLHGRKKNTSNVRILYSIIPGDDWASLDKTMQAYKGRIISEGVPVGEDSGGNQYVLVCSGGKCGQVYFWDHENEPNKPGYRNMSYIAASFGEFLDKLYEFTDPNQPAAKRYVEKNNIAALVRLLDSGYDIETLDDYNRTLIEFAAMYNRTEIIQLLFDRGAQLRNALPLAQQNLKFWKKFEASVELLERLQSQRDA